MICLFSGSVRRNLGHQATGHSNHNIGTAEVIKRKLGPESGSVPEIVAYETTQGSWSRTTVVKEIRTKRELD